MTDFPYTGSYDTYTVPAGVRKLIASVQGASGGDERHIAATFALGGHGAWLVTTVDVTPGEVLRIYVGGQGGTGTGTAAGAGGWNGGAAGGFVDDGLPGRAAPGGGGGATEIRRAPYALSDRICTAGGGGGGGGNNNGATVPDGYGGDAGLDGSPGANTGGPPGEAGTISAGGAGGGTGGNAGVAGTLGAGGVGGGTGVRGGGGGGGGLYGGGGGAGTATGGTGGGGGGGGYSWTDGTVDALTSLGTYGDGFASVTPIFSGGFRLGKLGFGVRSGGFS